MCKVVGKARVGDYIDSQHMLEMRQHKRKRYRGCKSTGEEYGSCAYVPKQFLVENSIHHLQSVEACSSARERLSRSLFLSYYSLYKCSAFPCSHEQVSCCLKKSIPNRIDGESNWPFGWVIKISGWTRVATIPDLCKVSARGYPNPLQRSHGIRGGVSLAGILRYNNTPCPGGTLVHPESLGWKNMGPIPGRRTPAVSDNPTKSSENINPDTVSSPTSIPCVTASTVTITSLPNTLSMVSDNVHSCATPRKISKQVDISSSPVLPGPTYPFIH